jgi:hypothetical protein
MQLLNLKSSLMCENIDASLNYLLIMVFFFSFLVFRFISKEPNLNPQEKESRMKKAEEYLNHHRKENELFFFDGEGDSQ